MWRHVDETNAQAVERWRQEHPGQDPDAPGLKVIILRWLKEGEDGAWDARAPLDGSQGSEAHDGREVGA
jgi:hypothetical protein